MNQDFDRRPDPLWREHAGTSRGRAALIVAGVIGVYAAIVIIRPQGSCSMPGSGPCSSGAVISATVKPIAPLGMSACVAEMRRWGRGGLEATSACRQGRGRAWFKAVVANTSGDRAAVLCDVAAFRASGRRIGATIPLPVSIVQEPGVMVLNGHQTRTVEWFFDPHDAPRTIGAAARFTAWCRPDPSPPV